MHRYITHQLNMQKHKPRCASSYALNGVIKWLVERIFKTFQALQLPMSTEELPPASSLCKSCVRVTGVRGC